jgi:hypothetical protein
MTADADPELDRGGFARIVEPFRRDPVARWQCPV